MTMWYEQSAQMVSSLSLLYLWLCKNFKLGIWSYAFCFQFPDAG